MLDLRSILGYSNGSPFAGNPYININTPEGLIDMSNTPMDLIGIDNKGNKKLMKAYTKNPYKFQGDVVTEIPAMQRGGWNRDSLINFLFEEDEEGQVSKKEDIPTAPDTSELEEQYQNRITELEDENTDLFAMNIVNEGYSNPYRRMRGESPRGVSAYSTSIGAMDTNEVAKTAFNYYQQKGLAPHVAAGIVGNLMQESQLNTGATGDGGQATGVAQWHPDRFKGLQSWASKNKKNPYALETQLDYILEEPNEGPKVLNALKNARNSAKAAVIFSQVYERPGKPAYKNRIGYAKSLHQKRGGTINPYR